MLSVAVFIDHQEAKIFHFEVAGVKQEKLHPSHHLHHTSKEGAKKHDTTPLWSETAAHLKPATEILVLGPGTAKIEFVHYLEARHKDVYKKLVGTEACDHPTDNQVLAIARRFFTRRHALSL